ncbi:alpha/beta hydrolase family protein [Plebeiibacterium sediminum]|uniref:Uncharacterized protein n=1 Tax=Plebeiibacterium sediminum TaxID=2992112 RepID=A0AAE3M5I2_9BACT|nr:hypothetical protein [Plebeiobacterium sediminum]MCW3787205.1 hypothetical protein [Plebeiobacterium sediminum]
MKLFCNFLKVGLINLSISLVLFGCTSNAITGQWDSVVVQHPINYSVTDPEAPLKDYNGEVMTVVYLENLPLKKVGQNSVKEDVNWLLAQGYRVVEFDYNGVENAISPIINKDIIAINDSLASGTFCGLDDCSRYRSYILFEGYRIKRDVPYFKDNPMVYNWPKEYTEGDSLYMDIIYPANPIHDVPVVLSFSYSNSYATYDSDKNQLIDLNKNQRLNLGNTLAGFNDSFLEGAPANGISWAIADHPKYCSWGKGKPVDGPNDAYKSYQVNPDAAQKVKSAIRTLRKEGHQLGLSGKIGVFGFSRGSDAGSMAIGDKVVPEFENAGFNKGVSDEVQVAVLGPGVFNFTRVYQGADDGDKNLEGRCPWVWGELKDNYELWEKMGSSYLVESSLSSPVLFFYNSDDSPYYHDQVMHLKEKLDSLGVKTSLIKDYGKGHSIPQKSEDLRVMYQFMSSHLDASQINK